MPDATPGPRTNTPQQGPSSEPRGAEIVCGQRTAWEGVSQAWALHQGWSDVGLAPLFRWMVEACALAPGMQVLDVACGPGEPALTAAARVGSGHVTAIDVSPGMLNAARATASARGVDIAFYEMEMERLAFPPSRFDAVTCCCGVMFAAEPVTAVREMLRVTRAAGRVAIAVWDKPRNNPFLAVVGRAVAALRQLPPPSFETPGPFRLCANGALEDLLRTAGVTQVDVSTCDVALPYESPGDYVAKALALGPGLAERVASLTPEERIRFEQLVTEGMAPFARESGFLLPGRARCAVTRKD